MFNLLKYSLFDIETGGEAPVLEENLNTSEATYEKEPSILSEAPIENTESIEASINFPEKYTVKNSDGSVNIEETARKLSDGYNNLAKKMGETGGKVPDTAEGYVIEFDPKQYDLPENVDSTILKNDKSFKNFLTKAHEKGFTNEQVNLVAGEYLEAMQSLFDRKMEDDKNYTKETLSKIWKTPDEMNSNLANARRAFEYFASEEEKAQIDLIGNNALVISLLAKIGSRMQEDSPIMNTRPSDSRETIEGLMRNEAYFDETHPEHQKVAAIVNKYYQDKFGDEQIY